MSDQKKQSKLRVVIVGGGFGGVRTALELTKDDFAEVTLVSERPDFYYYPALYHTATGGADKHAAIALEQLFADKPVQVILDKAVALKQAEKVLILESKKTLVYDKLIFALGVVTNYFGIPGLAENSYGIKSLEEAEQLKRHLHAQLIAEHEPDLNYVIVGGGPTGIELAGDIGKYLKHAMKKHGIKHRTAHVDLVEAMPHLMPRLPRPIGRAIERRLRRLGVKLYLNAKVQGETPDELTVSGKPIRSHTVIWTAGMANNPFFTEPDFKFSGRKKVLVDEFLRAEGSKDVFVIGDNAETPFSGMAQTAIYDADFVVHNLRCEHENRPKLAYRPKEPVYITPVGEGWASVLWKDAHFNGRVGWWLRSAADLKAFTELESLPNAAEQWAAALSKQDLCPVCGMAN